jgi:3-oxoadipate enol-lactonase/4-carboxymuconolactone decarboxylase
MTSDEARRRGAELIEQMMGPEQAAQVRAGWREICPDFEEYVVRFLSGEVWSRPGIDRRTKSLVTITALAAMGRSRGLELNLRMARNNGATEQDVMEVLLHIAPYAGFPAAWEGLALAHKVFREPGPGGEGRS